MRFKFAKRSDIKRYGPVNDADVGKIIKRKNDLGWADGDELKT